MTPFAPGLILEVARRAGLEVVTHGAPPGEALVRCPWPGNHTNGDEHPSCRLNGLKNTFFCDPCGRGGGVKEFAAAVGVDLTFLRASIAPSTGRHVRSRPPSDRLFESDGPISADLQTIFAGALGKAYSAATWAAFGVLAGLSYRKEAPAKAESAIAFPLPSGGFHVYFYHRPNRKKRWAFANGGHADLLTVGFDRPGPVLVCEGAWDAMRAYEDGFVVATGTGGAGTWNETWNVAFTGREVVDVHDTDPAGRKGAEKVTSSLVGAGVTVRAVVLPLSGEDGDNDLCDYRRTHSVDELRALIAQTPPVVPLNRAPRASGPAPGGDGDVATALTSSGLSALTSSSSLDQVETALRKLQVDAAPMDELGRAMLSEAAVRHLKSIGLRTPRRVIDAALGGTAAAEDATSGGGRTLLLQTADPWPEPVDGAALLDGIVAVFHRFASLVEGAAVAMALWVLHACTIDAFFVSPFLVLHSPTKRCGKTTVLDLVGALVPRPLPASNITAAALFRTVEEHQPTLLIDEADTFLAASDEMRGILNAGHTRTTAVVVRTVGDNHEPRTFSTWCAKVIALIGRLKDTLEDRSIAIPMRRKAKTEKLERLRRERLADDLEPLRRQAVRWAADHLEALRDTDPAVPEALNDRSQDNWRPLLAIADAAGGEWPSRSRKVALLLSGEADEVDAAAGVQLLADLRELYHQRRADRLPTEEILRWLTARDDRPWPEFSRNIKPLSPRQMARLLKPFGAKPKQLRQGDEKSRGYLVAELEDAFARYLPSDPVHPVQPFEINDLRPDPDPVQTSPCTGSKTDLSDSKQSPVPDVPDPQPPAAGEEPESEREDTAAPEKTEVFEV